MKKTYEILMIAATAFAAIISCNKEGQVQGDNGTVAEDPKVSMKATLWESIPKTKAALSETMELKWKRNDAIRVIGDNTETFTITDTHFSNVGNFSGEKVSGNSFTLIHPASFKSVAELDAISYLEQSQYGNGSVFHIDYFAALDGVDSYKDVTFSKEWASAHGGSFVQSGILQLAITVPEGLEGISSLSLAAAEDVFPTTNASEPKASAVTINIGGIDLGALTDRLVVVNMAVSAQGISIPDGTKLTLTLLDGADEVWTKEIAHSGVLNIPGSSLTVLVVDADKWSHNGSLSGRGTESAPYLISSPEELLLVNSLLVENTTVWFELTQDIDMTGKEWVVINPDYKLCPVHFDGKGFTVTGISIPAELKARKGFFGVLTGTVKNLNLDKISVYNITGYRSGALAAFIGDGAEGYSATVENVHITNAVIDNKGTGADLHVGGFADISGNSTFKDCSFEGSVNSAITATDAKGYTGGFIGYDKGGCTYEGCVFKGSVTSAGTTRTGGLIGHGSGAVLKDCSVEADITSSAERTGGIAGEVDGNNTISGCSFTGSIKSSATRAGGMVGYIWLSAEQTTTISGCHSSGDINVGSKTAAGGILGIVNHNADLTISLFIRDCWSDATVSGTTTIGGILGESFGANVSDCFFAGTLKGNGTSGGIVGRACKATTGESAATVTGGYGDSVTGCICWAELITSYDGFGRTTTSSNSDGAIVGYTNVYNTLSNCWRKQGLNFKWYADSYKGDWTDANNLKDQEDASASSALTNFPQGNVGHDYPYNGKVAGESETLSAVARRIGWSEDVWNLEAEIPTLK